MTILAVDIGTTALKMGVFRDDPGTDSAAVPETVVSRRGLTLVPAYKQSYQISVYDQGLFGDVSQQKWLDGIRAGCRELSEYTPEVDAVALSATTPVRAPWPPTARRCTRRS